MIFYFIETASFRYTTKDQDTTLSEKDLSIISLMKSNLIRPKLDWLALSFGFKKLSFVVKFDQRLFKRLTLIVAE